MSNLQRVFAIRFSFVSPFYVEKAQKNGRTKAEVDRITCWHTGYSQAALPGCPRPAPFARA